MAVSYTHLDVYKRQTLTIIKLSCFVSVTACLFTRRLRSPPHHPPLIQFRQKELLYPRRQQIPVKCLLTTSFKYISYKILFTRKSSIVVVFKHNQEINTTDFPEKRMRDSHKAVS